MYDNLDERDRKKISPILLLIIISQVIVVIVLAFVLGKIFTNSSDENIGGEERRQIKTNGLVEDLDWLSEQDMGEIEKALFKKMKVNSARIKLEDTNIVVREETMKKFHIEEIESDLLSFVVDLSDEKQSYRIYYAYPETIFDSENLAMVLCLDGFDEKIYEDFRCVDTKEDEEERRLMVATVVEKIDFEDYSVIMAEGRKVITIESLPNIAVDNEKRDEYISQVKQVINDLGVSPEMFEYRVMTPEDYVNDPNATEIYGG